MKTIGEVREKIVVVKVPADSDSHVAWTVFQSFANNQVGWPADYGLYARREDGNRERPTTVAH